MNSTAESVENDHRTPPLWGLWGCDSDPMGVETSLEPIVYGVYGVDHGINMREIIPKKALKHPSVVNWGTKIPLIPHRPHKARLAADSDPITTP